MLNRRIGEGLGGVGIHEDSHLDVILEGLKYFLHNRFGSPRSLFSMTLLFAKIMARADFEL